MSSRPASAAAAEEAADAGSRPASSTSAKSRPASSTSAKSRPASSASAKSRPASSTSTKSRPATALSSASRPASGVSVKSRPASGMSLRSRAASRLNGKSRPGSSISQAPITRPVTSVSVKSIESAKVWTESETGPVTDRSELSEQSADDNLLIRSEEPKKGCWHSFSHCVAGMWSTREMNLNADKEIFVRTTIRELVIYFLFLVVLCTVTFGMTSSTTYYYTMTMKSLFSEQPEVQNVSDFWDFMNNQLLNGIFWDYWYNDGDYRNYICPGGEESTGPCPVAQADRNILYENRLLGLPRIRQLRVVNDSCEIHPDFQATIKVCYAPYSSSIEDTDDFLPAFREHTSETAWIYRTAEEMETSGTSIGGVAGSYSGNGAVQNLHSVKNESQAIVNELMENLWVTRATRAVFVDFTVYNANINLFCVINLLFEFPATGGVIPGATYRTVKLIRYVSPTDYFIMACEAIYIVFIFYYIIEETLEIIKLRTSYFKGFWNNVDIIVVLLSIMNQCLNIYTFFVVDTELTKLLSDPDVYADFTDLGYSASLFKGAVAICVFFSWVKLFKYISFNKTMTQLSSTLTRCAGDIAGFSMMFFIVFFAFAQLGYLLFGTQVDDYSTFDTSIFTLLRTILGDFDFASLEASNRVLGPIFFLCYVFFVFFVLLNMFLAIINDTYSIVKQEIANQKNDFELSEYMKRGYNNMLGKVGMRSKLMDVENALRLAGADGEVTFDEVRQNLKKCNFSDMEIEMFFAKYDENGDGIFDAQEFAEITSDLDKDKVDRDAADRPDSGRRPSSAGTGLKPGGVINHEEFGMLANRVDRMEGVIGNIVSKIDTVLIKLENMEKSKSKKKAHMSNIMDVFTAATPNPEMADEDGGEDGGGGEGEEGGGGEGDGGDGDGEGGGGEGEGGDGDGGDGDGGKGEEE